MNRIASHRPSPAMVVALTALFFAVSGAGYAATQLSDSNGGPKAKASKKAKAKRGPQGPAGAQGSQGAAGGPGTTGAQGPGAVRLEFNQPETDVQYRILGAVNELTVLAECEDLSGRARLFVQFESSVAAEIEGTQDVSNNDATVAPQGPIAFLNFPAAFDVLPNADGQFKKSFVQATYFNGSRVISLQLFAVANDGGAGSCHVHGTAIPAG